MTIDKILNKTTQGQLLNKEEALTLLDIENGSPNFYKLISFSNKMTRLEYNNKGFIFAQIGLNAEPCSANCKFCSMGKDHYIMNGVWKKDKDSILSESRALIKDGIDDLFLMTTADYPIDKLLTIAGQIRSIIPDHIKFVANIGDFNKATALKLKEVGFTGVYHIHRLREGIDTGIKPEIRIRTLDAIKSVGLDLYYCVEPIGPEHSYGEIVDEMLRARQYEVDAMAVMRRIAVKNTPLFDKGQISTIELCKIAAVTRIVTRPRRSMNAHETTPMSLICGVNQLYAEFGANPRDHISNTETNRGLTVENVRQLLIDAEYTI